MEMIGPMSSRAPLMAASVALKPSDKCRSMFSTMTMASSTTMPTHRTMARRVSRLMVNPAACMRKKAPMIESGMATTGMTTARSEPRKRKMTTMTMRSVSASVLITS